MTYCQQQNGIRQSWTLGRCYGEWKRRVCGYERRSPLSSRISETVNRGRERNPLTTHQSRQHSVKTLPRTCTSSCGPGTHAREGLRQTCPVQRYRPQDQSNTFEAGPAEAPTPPTTDPPPPAKEPASAAGPDGSDFSLPLPQRRPRVPRNTHAQPSRRMESRNPWSLFSKETAGSR